MYRIQTKNNIAKAGLELFNDNVFDVSANQDNPHAIILRSANLHHIEFGNELLAVARAGAGTNNIPVDKLTDKGVVVFNTPGANANAVKELVIAGMLMASRNLFDACVYTKELKLKGSELKTAVESGKKKFAGVELTNRSLGVIGLGAIGVKVANAAIDLGMEVNCYDPGLTLSRALILNPLIKRVTSIEKVFSRSEFISFHVPLVDGTRGLLNEKTISHLRNESVVLNFSRHQIVDDDAILKGIRGNKVRTYVTDFPDEKLIHEPKVLSLPHLGASTGEAEETCAIMAVNQLQNFILTGNIANSVNFPGCELQPAAECTRISVTNDNTPGIIEHIAAVLSKKGFNIIDLLNQSRDRAAYTIIDVNGVPDESVETQLRRIPGIRKVRLICE